ncbi:hypothetical protein E2320_003563 [Naja naja]|nr:hypothetical protein E2320_003563 [Naja naja]
MHKAVPLSCPASDAFPVPHEWYQPGDLLTYGSLAQEKFQTTKRSPLYFMVPKEDHQYVGIIQLLHHFRWTWIGIFTMDNNNGERFLQKMQPILSQNGICSSFIQRLSQLIHLEHNAEIYYIVSSIFTNMRNSNTTTFLVYGESKEAEGKQFCCYDCVPCPEGKISNQKDMNDCFQCSEDHYPNKEKKGCILKPIVFLTFEETLGIEVLLEDRLRHFLHSQRTIKSILLLLQMHKAVPLSYSESDAFPVPHEWYQPGDLIISGMMSYLIYHFYQTLFNQHPFLNLHDSPLTYGSLAQEEFLTSKRSSLYFMVPKP